MNNTLGKIILFNQIEKRVALFHNSASSSNVSLKKSWILPLLLPLTFCHIADLFKISRGKSAVRRCIVREEMISEWISGYRKGLRVMINCWSGMFSLWLRTRSWKKNVLQPWMPHLRRYISHLSSSPLDCIRQWMTQLMVTTVCTQSYACDSVPCSSYHHLMQ